MTESSEILIKSYKTKIRPIHCTIPFISSTGAEFGLASELYSTNTHNIRQNGTVRQVNSPLLVKFKCFVLLISGTPSYANLHTDLILLMVVIPCRDKAIILILESEI